ncbi:methyl-accepting chemotaxis protein, partial [Fodinicurvata sp. EGI_FJ10296]|uniref:methyl-accepting chemotaxis protein n=1 Tax=Fodinicurvata sp. EGI_FJ10296 TaxID=3231908 RepID=UPI003456A301
MAIDPSADGASSSQAKIDPSYAGSPEPALHTTTGKTSTADTKTGDTKTGDTKTGNMSTRRGIGLRGKLMMAFAAVTAMTVAASAVAIHSFQSAENAFGGITQTGLPSIATAQHVATESAAFINRALDVSDMSDPGRVDELVTAMTDETTAMQGRLDNLESSFGPDPAIDEMREHLDTMLAGARHHADIVKERIAVDERTASRTRAIRDAHDAFLSAITPRLNASRESMVSFADDLRTNIQTAVEDVTGTAADNLMTVLQIRGDVILAAAVLQQAIEAGTPTEIETHRERFLEIAARIEEARPGLDAGADQLFLDMGLDRLLAFGSSESDPTLFDVRMSYLDGNYSYDNIAFLADATEDLQTGSASVLDTLERLMGEARQSMETAGRHLSQEADSLIDRMLSVQIREVQALQDIVADANLIAGLLNEAAVTADPERLGDLQIRFSMLASAIGQNLAVLGEDGDISDFAGPAQAIISEGMSSDSIFSQRDNRLAMAAEILAMRQQEQATAASLADTATSLTETVHSRTREAATAATDLLGQSRLLLVAIAVAGVLVSALIAWLYVGRSIVRRLTGLASSMNDLADGRLDVAIDERGRDEIAGMARSLAVFRRTAIEVEDANKRAADERERASEERRQARLTLADQFQSNVGAIVDGVSAAATEMQATASGMRD